MFVSPRYSEADYEVAMAMSAAGESDYAIARELGMTRVTVFNWRHRKPNLTGRPAIPESWRPPDEAVYSYLLGIYLGDGHISVTGEQGWRLGVTLDQRYGAIVEEVASAITAVDPATRVCRYTFPGAIGLFASSPVWKRAFPQHGPGRKHLRKIALVDWQLGLTRRHPEALLRGLIHSDGSRCINRFTTKLPSGRLAEYSYPRYFFSNLSQDIREIFCDHCELLGIRWTQSNHRNISVSHRDSVAILDSFIGPKS
jgi:hypothetical protein